MSRSAPVENSPSPSSRWIEWKGSKGEFSYYDKEKKENIPIKLPFTFIVLDRLATVRGYSKKMKSGFYSNEIRDTRAEPLAVKSFSDNRIVAQGFWLDIKDTVTARGGKFCINVYIAFKDQGTLKIGAIQMTGSAMGPWFDFEKKHGDEIYKKAVSVKSAKKGESDTIDFLEPVYTLTEITKETQDAAVELDKKLQTYLKGYFKRTVVEKAEHAGANAPESHPAEAPQHDAPEHQPEPEPEQEAPPEDENIPF